MALGLTVDLSELQRLSAQLNNGAARMAAAAGQVMARAVKRAERRAVWRLTAPGKGHVEGRAHRRTGRAAGSVGSRIATASGAGGHLEVVGTLGMFKSGESADYFRVLEEGHGGIRPTRAKVLTIPLEAALTPAGVPRFTARGAAEFYEHTFWHRSKAGKLILFGESGGELTPLFVGVASVGPWKGIGYLSKSAEEQVEPMRAELNDWFARSFIKDRG
jgi:hypothetical protein